MSRADLSRADLSRAARSAFALLVALVGAAVLLGTGSAPASACSCAISSPATRAEADARLAASDVVFAGRLVDRREPLSVLGSSTDEATLTFEVSSVYKGVATTRQQVRTAVSGASCGLEISGEGPFLLFTDRADDGRLTASLCGGATAQVSLASWPGSVPATRSNPTGAGGARGRWLAAGALGAAGLTLGAVLVLRRRVGPRARGGEVPGAGSGTE